MQLLQIIGISFAILFTIWILFYTGILGWNMMREPLRTRNPVLLLVSSLGLLFTGSTKILHACSIPIPCFLLRSIRLNSMSLVILPGLLRGMQYLVLINKGYRRRFPRFKNPAFCFFCNLTFSIFHAGVGNTLIYLYGAASNDCLPVKAVASYTQFVIVCLIFVTMKIFRLIPWEYDEYHIAEDLKHCSIFWAVAVSTAIILTVVVSAVLDKEQLSDILLDWVHVLTSIGTFLVTLVRPIHVFIFHHNKSWWYAKNIKERKMSKRYKMKKIHVENAGIPKISRKRDVDGLKAYVQSPSTELQVIGMVLENTEATKKLHDFSSRRLCAETTLFLERANKYKLSWMVESEEESLITITSIIEDFIKPRAPYSINISGTLRNAVLNSATTFMNRDDDGIKFPHDFFDECYDEMCELFFSNLANSFANDDDFWLICMDHFDEKFLEETGVVA